MPVDRKKRVALLRRVIVRGILTLIVLLATGCVILGFFTYKYKKKADRLEARLNQISEAGAADNAGDVGTDISSESSDSLSVDAQDDFGNDSRNDSGNGTGDNPGSPADGVKDEFETATEEDYIRQWEENSSKSTSKGGQASGIHKVYLTFDDGPSIYTDEILDILNEYNVKATFFVAGQGKDVFSDKLKRIVDEGHTLGMHTYSHKYGEIYKSKEAFIKDFNAIQDFVYDKTGVHPTVYRFPGGSSNHVGRVPIDELVAYLDELGIEYYDWNISAQDATGVNLTPAAIARNCTANLNEFSTAIILMHDAGDKYSTVQALPEIIETIISMDDTVILPIDESTYPVHHGEEDN